MIARLELKAIDRARGRRLVDRPDELVFRVGHEEPAHFRGVIGPERNVDLIRHHPGAGRERGYVGKGAGAGERGGQGRAGDAAGVVDEAINRAAVEAGREDVAVRRVGAEADDRTERGEVPEIAHVFAELCSRRT